MLYPVDKDSKYGFINAKGELIVEPRYDLVGPFSEDRCIVDKHFNDRLQGYINSQGEEVIALRPCHFCDSFSEGLAQFEVFDGKVGFIDKSGVFEIPPQFEFQYEGEASQGFSERKAGVAYQDGFGYIDRQGKEIFEGRFERAHRFQDGYAFVRSFDSQGGEHFFIDTKGQRLAIIPCRIPYLSNGFSCGLCKVLLPVGEHDLTNIGFINTSGNLAFEEKFRDASDFHEGVSIVSTGPTKEDGKQRLSRFGVINMLGEWVVEPLYQEIGLFNHGIAPYKKDNKWGLLSMRGDIVLQAEFLYINKFNGYLRSDYGSEFAELTTAIRMPESGKSAKKTMPYQDEVYINRAGEIVGAFSL